MGKKVLCAGLLFFFLAGTSAFAASSGNCVLPLKETTEHYGVGAAFDYNYVGSRMLKLKTWNNRQKDMHINSLNEIGGKVLVALGDDANLYARVGSCTYKLKFKDSKYDNFVTVSMKNGIYAGLGGNALHPLYEMGDFTFNWGYDLQIEGFLNGVKDAISDELTITDSKGSFYGVDGKESIYITCKYNAEKIKTIFVPYIGAYHSWIVIGNLKRFEYQRADSKSGDADKINIQGSGDFLSFGLLLGLDVEVAKYICLNVEGRMIGENAISAGATLKF